jgi:hypothetical protein
LDFRKQTWDYFGHRKSLYCCCTLMYYSYLILRLFQWVDFWSFLLLLSLQYYRMWENPMSKTKYQPTRMASWVVSSLTPHFTNHTSTIGKKRTTGVFKGETPFVHFILFDSPSGKNMHRTRTIDLLQNKMLSGKMVKLMSNYLFLYSSSWKCPLFAN